MVAAPAYADQLDIVTEKVVEQLRAWGYTVIYVPGTGEILVNGPVSAAHATIITDYVEGEGCAITMETTTGGHTRMVIIC